MSEKNLWKTVEDAREARDSAARWLAHDVAHAHLRERTAAKRWAHLHESRVRFMDAQDAYTRALDAFIAAMPPRETEKAT